MRSPFFLPEARERLRSSLRLVAQEQSRKTPFFRSSRQNLRKQDRGRERSSGSFFCEGEITPAGVPGGKEELPHRVLPCPGRAEKSRSGNRPGLRVRTEMCHRPEVYPGALVRGVERTSIHG